MLIFCASVSYVINAIINKDSEVQEFYSELNKKIFKINYFKNSLSISNAESKKS